MPCIEHPHLEEVSNRIVIWKFMTFEHFADLIKSGSLYFCRVGAFEDVFEGTYPIANKHLRPEIYKDGMIPNQADYDKIERVVKHDTFASCFHMNRYETAFMWNLYADRQGVAIKTTTGRLKEALNTEQQIVYLSKVYYQNYDEDFLPEGNLMYLALHKRKSFEAEKELRALILDKDSAALDGIKAKVDLKELLYEVYVSPYADKSTVLSAQELIMDHGIRGVKVIASDLYTLR